MSDLSFTLNKLEGGVEAVFRCFLAEEVSVDDPMVGGVEVDLVFEVFEDFVIG